MNTFALLTALRQTMGKIYASRNPIYVIPARQRNYTQSYYFEPDTANKSYEETEFHQAVDDYLAFCKDLGKEPNKPYKGLFNVRISPELHRKAAIAASLHGETLNAFVTNAIRAAVE